MLKEVTDSQWNGRGEEGRGGEGRGEEMGRGGGRVHEPPLAVPENQENQVAVARLAAE